METSAFIKSLVQDGQLLASAAEEAGPDAAVPTCPAWQVRHLLRHTGMVHRWATGFVAEGHTEYRAGAGAPDLDGDELLEWFQEGHGLLVGALSEAPPDLSCWSFLPAPSPLHFWARRQAHETAVHRADAQSAAGGGPGHVAAPFAVDGAANCCRPSTPGRRAGSVPKPPACCGSGRRTRATCGPSGCRRSRRAPYARTTVPPTASWQGPRNGCI
ncbi:hypothetical protein GCM10010381_21870 [Streptomyces xantholiticus]|nr:hypothetical protein GCM10010381_21870 [Streptomyces xantholiticus]